VLREGQNCWRIAEADRLSVIVDAERYFAFARDALLRAERRIMLVGWDFDARIMLTQDGIGPKPVGDFLYWLVERNPRLNLYLLRWDIGAFNSLFRGRTVLTVIRWMRHPRIHLKFDGHHPTGSSHHQKIVSIDDRLAFCGGIDMTAERWDTREHRDDEPGRVRPGGKPYKPWHDATTCFTGPAAVTMSQVARDRWALAGGNPIEPLEVPGDAWPTGLDVQFRDVRIGVARTQPAMPDCDPIHEVEALFLDQIASAKRFLYCESQYFASRRIADAIARRLEEPDGPEIVIVNPLTAQGWLEPIAMDTARARLVEALNARDPHRRLRIYHPYTTGGTPIYCHAKVTIVDDCSLRVGSANMNNRSLRLDTECDVALDQSVQDHDVTATIAAIRDDLLAEHLDVPPARVTETLARTGSLIATVEALQSPGRSLRPYEVPDLDAVRTWLADNEVLDPEGPDEMFEPFSGKGLFRGRLGRRWRRRR
jgi:phosphatidylserine/phosphatidylglycerophosphate/cardiolipin synthase-like enzyme